MKNLKYKTKTIITHILIIMCCWILVGCNNEEISASVQSDLVSKLIEDNKIPKDTNNESCNSYTISNAPLPSTTHYFYRIGVSDRYVLVVFKKLDDDKYHLDCKIVTWDGEKTRDVGNDTIPDWKSSNNFEVDYEDTGEGYEEIKE